jgi:hypothetical protein
MFRSALYKSGKVGLTASKLIRQSVEKAKAADAKHRRKRPRPGGECTHAPGRVNA